MRKLTPLETHKLIKQYVPEAVTVYQEENKNQITFAELHEGWDKFEAPQAKEK